MQSMAMLDESNSDDLMNFVGSNTKKVSEGALLKPKPIRHPAWRVYKALRDCALNPVDYMLKEIDVEYIYKNEDDLTKELKVLLQARKDKVDTEGEVEPVEDAFGITECLDVFMNTYDRQLIEGLLLAGKPIPDICDVVECEADFVIVYKSLFFDISVFRNNVDKLIYVKKGTIGTDMESKSEVMAKGTEYLKAKYGVSSDKISIADVLTDAFAKAYIKMIRSSEDDCFDSQEISQGWATVLVKLAAEIGKDKGGNLSINDLVVHLQGSAAPTKGIADLD